VLSSTSATVRTMVYINRMPDAQQIMDGTTYRRLKASRYDLHDGIPRENPVSVMQHALTLMCIHPCKDTRTTARPTVVIFSVQCRLKKRAGPPYKVKRADGEVKQTHKMYMQAQIQMHRLDQASCHLTAAVVLDSTSAEGHIMRCILSVCFDAGLR
jgi:hypothetical protein